jgi:hypothetical protein
MLARTVQMLPVIAYDEITLGTQVEPIETIVVSRDQPLAPDTQEQFTPALAPAT